jgi:hypothetical protein
MHKHLTAMLAAGALIAGGGLAFSHDSSHYSFSALYDINRPAMIGGTVTAVDWTAPRSFLTVEGPGPNGRLKEYRIDLGSPHALERNGWRHDTVKQGETVTVIGWYARNDDSRIKARRLKLHGRDLDAAPTFFEATMANHEVSR